MTPLVQLESLTKQAYNADDLSCIEALLLKNGTLAITPLPSGLFAASSGVAEQSQTGYQNVWLRDNVMVANSFLLRGDTETARRTVKALTALLQTQESHFEAIIQDPVRMQNVQERPHVRFSLDHQDAESEKWPHAQNDALGYALWLRFVLANAGQLDVSSSEFKLYRLFPLYFNAIEYWNDADSGAWEEDLKINSSSIGAVVAGLSQMSLWLSKNKLMNDDRDVEHVVETLIAKGKAQLQMSIPHESPPIRGADGALVFLLYPSDVLTYDQQNSVLDLVRSKLEREIGIIRYVGDSYYGQDYPDWFSEAELTADFSERVEIRNAKLKPGFEAQWCLFDPLLSVIYGKRFLANPRGRSNLEQQTRYFNRSLRQLSDDLKCPELYYFRHGKWIPNPHLPLAWTQANLALALHFMKKSAASA